MRNGFSSMVATFAVMPLVLLLSPATAEEVSDDEAASHSSEAAIYQLLDTYDFSGIKIEQYDLAVLSHFSYVVYSGGECLIVDPGRDIDVYVAAARNAKVKIVGVWLTHSHADFIAGHAEFSNRLKVPVHISKRADAVYQHVALQGGDTMEVGNAVIRFLETPGHTPDSMCGVVSHKDAAEKPLALLTGDTLFVGGVGRPDLLGEGTAASALASMMFDSWTDKLSKLPDDVTILPAHGAGSLCGAHLSDEPVSTIGEQRAGNAYLQYKNRGEFVAAILNGLPEAPQYFAHNAAINREGPAVVNWALDELPLVGPGSDLTDPKKYYVVDIRDAGPYAKGHIPNSVNIALRGRFETWMGIMVPWDSRVVVTGSAFEMTEALFRLHRVGYRAECIASDAWQGAGLPMAQNEMVSPRELHKQMQILESPIIVDVRLPKEWVASRIGNVLNIPLTELSEQWVKLDRSQHVVAVCNSAYRSSLAVGILERNGFQHASSMAGGLEAWIEAGLPVFGAGSSSAGNSITQHQVKLPGRIGAMELNRLMLDLPGTFQVIDIRPPDHFADYHLPGAENVTVATVVGTSTYLGGADPLIIVDRDGSLAMAVAGILSQKTDRPIKALYGGLESYWNHVGPNAGSRAIEPSNAANSSVAVPPGSDSKAPAKRKRRRSAGC